MAKLKRSDVKLELAVHRRVLEFLNEGNQAEDLVYEKLPPPNPEMPEMDDHGDAPDDHPPEDKAQDKSQDRKVILDPDIAQEIIEFRDEEYPLGFRNLREVLKLEAFGLEHIERLRDFFGYSSYGRWTVFPQAIPRLGPGGYDGVVHAALLHTGRVLFITADETTLLWNPDDTTPTTFELPVNQPQTTPDAASGYSVLCGGHSFLSDGRLLVAGGGGYGPHDLARWGYMFDPNTKTWTRTTGSMVHHRWYPTVLTLGDHRVGASREVLVVCGHGAGDMEVYDEATDSFREVTSGDTKPFPNLYPGLHLLPNDTIFYSRTGWASAGPGGGPFTGDDQSSFFALTGASTGSWTDIASATPSMPDRTKGMSVLLVADDHHHVRILALGGSDASNNNSYEIVDATAPSPTTAWGAARPFPDSEHRSLASAVLLPDGNVFVCGGIQRTNSPCASFDPRTKVWSSMATMPSARDYHSVAVLLASGQVAVAGWNNTAIEVFDPPYLFRGPRPVITAAPSSVQRGETFDITSPDAGSITKTVLVRPMAVTHQTDTEQRVLHVPQTLNGFSTFGTIETSGAVTDRFGVGQNFDALTFASTDVGYGPDLFYFLRNDGSGFSTFGTIDTGGAVTDRFGVGQNFDALVFAPGNRGYGPNLFYYLRHDSGGFSTFGSIDTSGAVTDRFGVGLNFDALTFAPGNHGYGPKLFYYLRHDVTGLTLTAPGGSTPQSLAPQGYYMLFALNGSNVPSVASWLYLA